MSSAPHAPGQLGAAPHAQQLLAYLGELDVWLAERRSELDALDAQVLAENRQAELDHDMTLSMALWQAAKTRQVALLTAWDSGRVGPAELDKLTTLIWGRLETADSPVAALQSMAVSLPEATRLSDALTAQLQSQLATDPDATALQIRLTALRAQAERLRDQIALDPPAFAVAGRAKLAALEERLADLASKKDRGADISGLLNATESDAARFERDLIVGAARRRQGRELLSRVRAQQAEALRLADQVSALNEQVRAEVQPALDLAVPDVHALGPIPNTAAALSGYSHSLDAITSALGEVRNQLSARLAQADAVRDRWETLKATAAATGRTQDPVLAQYDALLAARLSDRPIVLDAVEQLVSAFAAELGHAAGSNQ